MPLDKLELILDTHRRNLRFSQYDKETVLLPLEQARNLVGAFHKLRSDIEADRRLTPEGKADARAKARSTTLAALKAWHEPRLQGLDADLLQQRAALMTQTERPDQARIMLMANELAKFTPQERAVLYGSAADADRRVLEAASAATGPLPTKSANGLEWKKLLDDDMVQEAVLARAAETNPAAATKVQELVEIREMQVTIAGIAEAEIREAMG